MKDTDDLLERMMQGLPVKVSENERLIIVTPNMTAKQYAAIKLQVPRSGDPDLDAMIRESRRADFITASIGGFLASSDHWVDADVAEKFAEQAAGIADAMLAEWEKGSV